MKSLREAWGQTLADLGGTTSRMLVLDPDVANSTKADIFAAAYPERFLQLGIAEQNAIGAAVGLASRGYIPWVSSFSVFVSHRAIDQIRMLVAQTGANVKIAGAYAGLLTGLTGRTHQDVEDIAILRAMPGMTLLSPADAIECAAMVRWATEYDGPVYMRVARDPESDVFDDNYEFVPGRVHMLRSGGDVTFVSTGVQTARVLRAAELLSTGGIEAAVVHVPSLKPLDVAGLLNAVAGTPLIVTVEEHSVLGGLGGLVAEIISGAGGSAPLKRIGIKDVWTESAPNDFLLDKYGLSPERVAAQTREYLAR